MQLNKYSRRPLDIEICRIKKLNPLLKNYSLSVKMIKSSFCVYLFGLEALAYKRGFSFLENFIHYKLPIIKKSSLCERSEDLYFKRSVNGRTTYCLGAGIRLGALAGTPSSTFFSVTTPLIVKTRGCSPSFVSIVTVLVKGPTR